MTNTKGQFVTDSGALYDVAVVTDWREIYGKGLCLSVTSDRTRIEYLLPMDALMPRGRGDVVAVRGPGRRHLATGVRCEIRFDEEAEPVRGYVRTTGM